MKENQSDMKNKTNIQDSPKFLKDGDKLSPPFLLTQKEVNKTSCWVKLSRVEREHLHSLLRQEQISGEYRGIKKHYYQRIENLLRKLAVKTPHFEDEINCKCDECCKEVRDMI